MLSVPKAWAPRDWTVTDAASIKPKRVLFSALFIFSGNIRMLHFLILYSPFKSANGSKILFIDVKIHLKFYREHGAVQIAGHIDGSPVHVHYFLCNGKSQARAPVLLERDCSTR